MTTLLAALGNAVCGDDGAGPLALAILESLGVPPGVRRERVGDPLLLIELWRPDDHVVLLDAAAGAAAPGSCLELDALAQELPEGVHPLSSHGMGLAEAVALARALGRLPASLTVYAIVGTAFRRGDAVTEPVKRAADRLARRLHDVLAPVPRAA